MTDSIDEEKNKIRRSLGMEFIRLEDDVDLTRNTRLQIIGKLAGSIDALKVVDEQGGVSDDTGTALQVINTTLKALNDLEVGSQRVITLKLKQQEQAIASSQSARERIEIVLRATAPGKLEQTFPTEDLEAQLEEMFGDSIEDFETRLNPRDID